MNILSIDQFRDDTLKRIFSAELGWHFKGGFEMAISQLTQPVVDASLELYKSTMANLHPTPAKVTMVLLFVRTLTFNSSCCSAITCSI